MQTILSLFSGIGGLERGIEAATGARVVCQVERDPFARRILARHWPQAERMDDVAAVGPEWRGVDLLCGGFPCQPHSLAGEREAGDDERDLWPETARILREVQPKAAIFENVPGLLTSRTDPKNPATKGHFFLRILKDCQKAGYLVRWDCCPASAVGAQHRRDRVFIVCTRNGGGWQNMTLSPIQEPLFGTNPVDWPRAGAWAGQAYEARPRWPVVEARWPTPLASDWRSGKCSDNYDAVRARPLREVIWHESGKPESGALNPAWVEWLMGFPPGWTLPEAEEGTVTVTLPPDVDGWAVPAGYTGPAEVVAENGDSVDIRWIGGPGDGEIEPVDQEHIADSAKGSLARAFPLPLNVEPPIPRFDGGAHGRPHRIRCLGNAVVPAVAEAVARSLLSIF